MEQDRWERLWSVFHGALERPEGEDRAVFLESACGGDPSLREELRSLLAAHAAGTATGVRPDPERTVQLPAEAAPGSQIGSFRIVRRIGEGGMGIVYEALQEAPVQRRVALKLIKLGMDTREVVRRFEAERQALALMDHSSIARVLDAGATAEGRPYFVMELVGGPPLTEFCDSLRLPIRRRIALLATVCRAVHSAHQKGVIHRDLKASNVLVAVEEGGPVPKVIDFGIARAVERPYGDESLLTRLGELVGTPETMSPEQAAMSADLDTRTDIYSLGALLYELLTGVKPFEFGRTPLPDILRRIREVEPRAPSACFSTPDAGARERAALRGGGVAHLRRELRGELDWIVAKAMAKERDRRYASAAELADDLERHLGRLPVSAGPPSRLYRARKLVERHRIETAAAAALLVALVAFGVAMAIQSRRLARALEVQERERATATEVSEFLVELLEQPDPEVARGADPTVKQVLDWGAAKLERDLAAQPEIRARLLETIGRVQLDLGAFDKAEPVLRKALELRRQLSRGDDAELAAALQQLAALELERARYAPASELADEALAIRRRALPEGDPAIADTLDLLGSIERQAGRPTRAVELHEQALAIKVAAFGETHPAVAESLNVLGIARRWSDDYAGAEQAYRRAYEVCRQTLGADHPDTAMAMNNLALVVHVRGDYDSALDLFETLVPLRRKLLGDAHPDLQVTLANYAKLLHDRGELERAAAVYQESIAVGRRGVGDEHPNMANAFAGLSAVLARLGRFDEALASARKALAIRERIFGPEHRTVAAALSSLAQVHAARGDLASALALHERAVEMLHRTSPGEARLAEALEAFGNFVLDTGDAPRACAVLEEAVVVLRARVPADDRRLAEAEGSLGACLVQLGRHAQAEPLLTHSLATLARYENPETELARQRLAGLRRAQGR